MRKFIPTTEKLVQAPWVSGSPTMTPHMVKRGMQAYPSYPNPCLMVANSYPRMPSSRNPFDQLNPATSEHDDILGSRSLSAPHGSDDRINPASLIVIPVKPAWRDRIRLKKSERDERSWRGQPAPGDKRMDSDLGEPPRSQGKKSLSNLNSKHTEGTKHSSAAAKTKLDRTRSQTTSPKLPAVVGEEKPEENPNPSPTLDPENLQPLPPERKSRSNQSKSYEKWGVPDETSPGPSKPPTFKLCEAGKARNRPKSIKKSTTAHSDSEEEDHDEDNNCGCTKCLNLEKRLKVQTQTTKNFQRQNGCLESIITQKRNLVDQLNRQVQSLIKENVQLAKSAGVEPTSTSPRSSPVAEDVIDTSSNLDMVVAAVSVPTLPVKPDGDTPGTPDSGRKTNLAKRCGSKTARPSSKAKASRNEGTSHTRDLIEKLDKQILSLQKANEGLQKRADKTQKEHTKTTRLLTDLLYTLNARGYESITDFDGSIVDLYRCRGDHLLELKGRDARIRTPAKRMTPQETLLKAVIGSQEKLIQNLFSQLDSRTRDALLGTRLSSSESTSSNSGSSDGNRNAALESEILALVSLIEGACQRNPDIFNLLQEQAIMDRETKHSSGLNSNNIIIEAVLERCQRMLCTGAPPTSPRLRSKGRELAAGNPRSGTPPPFKTRNGSTHRSGSFEHQLCATDDVAGPLPDLPVLDANKYGTLPRPVSSKGNHRNPTTAKWSAPMSPLRAHSASNGHPFVSENLLSSKRRSSSVTRCRYCGMKFPAHTSLAEINSHMEMHSL